MTEAFKQQIETEARQAVTELLAQANLKKVTCSWWAARPVRSWAATSARIPVWKPRRPCMRALRRCWRKTASGWQRSAVSI